LTQVIVIGNPVDGLQFIGPFKTGNDAIAWANRDANIDADWWVAPLEEKEGFAREGAA
jgi:hypothetical protein